MAKKKEVKKFSYYINLLKGAKNALIVFAVPYLLWFSQNYHNILSVDQIQAYGPILGMLSYMVKNYYDNKDLGKK